MTKSRQVADFGAGGFTAGKNKIINGDFSINQRNFTSVTAGATFTFDRYITSTGGTSGTVTYTPQVFTPGTAPVTEYEGKNFMQMVTASYTVADSWAGFTQSIESVRTFAGQTITFSFWAKANTGTPKLGVRFQQFFGTTGSPSAPVNKYATVTAISTSWARYSVTVTLDSLAGKTISTDATDRLSISLIGSAGSSTFEGGFGSMLQNNTFQIWGWQVEAGSVATPFTTATGTVQGELAACQRYLPAVYYGNSVAEIGNGFCISATQGFIQIPFAVQPRVAPTGATISSASHFQIRTSAGATQVPTTLVFNNASLTMGSVLTGGNSGMVAGNGTTMQINSSSGQILFTGCEL